MFCLNFGGTRIQRDHPGYDLPTHSNLDICCGWQGVLKGSLIIILAKYEHWDKAPSIQRTDFLSPEVEGW